MIALASLGGLAVLIAGQTSHQPRTYLVKRADPTLAAGPQSKPARQFSIYTGKFQLNLDEEPLIGPPTAPHVMVSLFDYTCHHCRAMHGYLTQAHRTFSNQLAIVNLPMPLESSCNRMVKRTYPAHTNACEYARIGLAVWRANRKFSAQFDDWIFAPPPPPPLAEARRYAAELVGQAAFAETLEQQWIDNQILRNVAIYEASFLQDRNGRMPQLIIGEAFISGPLNHVSDLYGLLLKELSLTAR
jgi:protein-disulfide isomerase